MITGKELRIGNLVYLDMLNDDLTEIIKNVVSVHPTIIRDLHHGKMNTISPIPLTPEWLERFGFYLTVGRMFLPMNYYRGLEVDNIRVVLHDETGYKFLCNLEYVHQLQNLYFALNGKELELKQ